PVSGREQHRCLLLPGGAAEREAVDEHDRLTGAVILVVEVDRCGVLHTYGDVGHGGFPPVLRVTRGDCWQVTTHLASLEAAGQPFPATLIRREGGRRQCPASPQSRPTPIDTSSGTDSGYASPIWRRTSSSTCSRSPGATSKTSSSCTCNSIRERSPADRSATSTRSIATLMTSAAEPWIGALSAMRSAISRRCRLSEVRSGR